MRSHREGSTSEAWRVAAQAWDTEERKSATRGSAAVLGRASTQMEKQPNMPTGSCHQSCDLAGCRTSCYRKRSLGLRCRARTDRAIRADTIVFMAVSFFESEADNTIVATRCVGDTKNWSASLCCRTQGTSSDANGTPAELTRPASLVHPIASRFHHGPTKPCYLPFHIWGEFYEPSRC